MKQTGFRKFISALLALTLVTGLLPSIIPYAQAAYDETGTTYVRVNSLSDIVPNARYIVVGEYEAEGVDTDYFAMSTMTTPNDDIRVGLTATTYTDETRPNFTMSSDKQTLTLHSDSILKLRMRKATYGSHEDLYKLEVDGEGFLYGFCNSYYYYSISCCRELKVLTSTRGEPWWHFRMGENGYWQIATYMDANNYTDIVNLTFNDAYRDFMSYCYADNVRIDGETYFFESYIPQDRDTNILLYREICAHKEVTHIPAVTATCGQPGNPEYWYCAGCETYSATADISEKLTVADTFTPPIAHTDSCGHIGETKKFELYISSTMGSNQSGEHYLLVGKAGDKYYAMGNETHADGTRNAVEITPNSNGILTAESHSAEFLTYYWPDNGATGFLADGGYFSALDGKIVSYDATLYGTNGYIPNPAWFSISDYETGCGSFFAYSARNSANEYISFDAEKLCFIASDTRSDSTYLYRQLCPHTNISYTPGADAACTEQGVYEHWYCNDCYRYYTDSSLELPVEVYHISDFTKPATGHSFDRNGICSICGMPRTYTQVSTLEQFDALNDHTTYMIVIKDGDKTYAAALPPKNPVEIDDNSNGLPDIAEPDTNMNGILDCVETYIDNWGGADLDEDGVTTAEEYKEYIGDLTEDGIVDETDCIRFFEYYVHWDMMQEYDWQLSQLPNFVEVAKNSDDTITISDETPMEFQMMAAGVWGSQLPMEGEDKEFGILDTERIRAAWIPNFWIGASGQMGAYEEDHFMKENRYYGDRETPGILDHKNWKISFNPDGTACLVDTWESYDNTGALQLVKYTNEEGDPAMTIVGLPEWLWGDSPIMSTRTEQLPVYLYAAEPSNIHTCEFGDWIDSGDGRTHTHTCKDTACGKTEAATHGWDNGKETKAPTCTEAGEYTHICSDCGAIRTEAVEALDHDWDDWTYASVDSHVRDCKRNCGVSQEMDSHHWGDWTAIDGNTHTMTCAVCSGYQSGAHDWDEGVITHQPTEEAEGVKTYTCSVCSHTKTEPVAKLEHEHQWSNWGQNDEITHIRSCHCNETQTEEHDFDEGVIVNWATHIAPGERHYTCADCGYVKSEEIPALADHEWSDWVYNKDSQTHTRSCICNETETANCAWDEGVVTAPPTHFDVGVKTYACAVCSGTKTETISKTTEHDWTDWHTDDNGTTHTRLCKCGESETVAHVWSDWAEAPTAVGSYQRACADCGAAEQMIITDDKPVNTTPTDNAANANLGNTNIELIDKILTDEEQSQIAAGAEVKIYLKVEDISSNAPTEHKAEAAAKAGDAEIGMYLDIDLFKQIGGESETPVTKTSGAVTVTITIPETLINTDESVIRTYKIIRVHEDENGNLITDVIAGIYDPETNTFTFETDKFSTYALAYVDKSSAVKGDFNGDGQVTDADAVYLLRYTLFPEDYPISQNGDMNNSGQVTDADAVYLLRHTLFPGDYPLN